MRALLLAVLALAACTPPADDGTSADPEADTGPYAVADAVADAEADAGFDLGDLPDAGPEPPWIPRHGPWVGEHPFRPAVPGVYSRLAPVPGVRLVAAIDETGLVVLDVDAGPIGRLDLGGPLYDLAVSPDGQTAYVGGADLWVVDLGDPRRPTSAGALRTVAGATHVARTPSGATLLVASGRELVVADLDDPHHPAQIGTLPIPDLGVQALALTEDLAFVGSQTASWILDLDEAVVVAELPHRAEAIALSRDGSTAWLSTGGSVRAWDVRTPAAPRFLSESLAGWVTRTIALTPDGRRLLVAAEEGLEVLSVTDPVAPTRQARFEVGSFFRDVAVLDDGRALVAARLDVFPLDLSAPGAPPAAHTRVDDLYMVSSVALGPDGRTAYVGGNGIAAVDAADPAGPRILSRDDSAGEVHGLTLRQQTLYAASYESLLLLDVRAPAAPALVETIPLADYPRPLTALVTADGRRAYVATEGGGGIDTFDLSTPPVRRGHHYSRHVEDVALSADEQTVFIADSYEGGLVAVDVRDPDAPVFQGRLAIAMHAIALSPDGTLLAAVGAEDLLLVDVRDPASPELLGRHPLTPRVFGQGDVAFTPDGSAVQVALGPAGLVTFDVRDPSAPWAVAVWDLPGEGERVVTTADASLVAGRAGLARLATVAPPVLTRDGPPEAGVQALTLRWTDRDPAHPEQLAWQGPGDVTVVAVDQDAATARLAWRLPGEAATLRVAVGNHHGYDVARISAE
ncbi:MAG: hypothetical protein H6706_29990 [Myxococcales bacterium]|nr:hypothetical protein [Myxococcales bacterium]